MINVDSISILHELLGCEKPKHPLITLINFDRIKPIEKLYNTSITLNFYMITLKDNPDCEFKYGRKYYDFSEGSLIFASPGQILTIGEYEENPNANGWMLCVHSDLIK